MTEQLPGGLPGGSPALAADDREAAIETASDTSQELFSAAHSEAADWADANEQQGHEAEVDETARQDDAPDTTAHNNADEEHTAEENPVDTPNIASVDADRSTEEAPVASAEETAAASGNAEPNSEDKESSQEQNRDSGEHSSKPTFAPEGTDAAPESTADADFDDFGDFEEGEFEQTPAPAPAPARESEPMEASAPVDPGVKPLEIDGQSAESIATQVHELLPTDFGINAPELGQEDIRQVEGLSQVLVTESSRTLFRDLHGEESLPTQMLSWKKSQTRRQQLIALGVPINLDEVLGGDAQQKELPPLELHVESAPAPAPAPEAAAAAASAPASDTPESSVQTPESAPVPGERLGDRRRRELGVNVPFVDSERIEQITRLTEDDLKLQSLPALRSLVKELQALSTQTTELLAYHLMLRDMFTADSDMYNAMIKDLVAGASTRVASRNRGSLSFMSRSSRPGTPTGRNTPT